MFPVIDEKMNAAGQVATPTHGVKVKSVVALPTTPVGRPPGTVTKFSPGFSTSGEPEASPRSNVALLVPLLDIQKGLVPLKAIPQGLTSSGSWTGARPGISETKLVWR